MTKYRSANTPLEVYHGVPKGWSKEEIVSRYKVLGGKSKIELEEATEPGAPYWLPDRYRWLQYRATLYRIAEGVKDYDHACVELAVQFIELNYFGSYSGYIREKLARSLRGPMLSFKQAVRLKRHFQNLRDQNLFLQEFREYRKLEARIVEEWPKA